MIIATIFGSYLVARGEIAGSDSIISNSSKIYPKANKVLELSQSAENYLTFNPIEIIKQPESNPWNDLTRRWAFPEYFFKTAFFGEFNIPGNLKIHAQCLMLLALLSLPMLVGQAIYSFKILPVVLSVFFGLLGVIYFRHKTAVAPAQDFRYFAHFAVCLFALLFTNVNNSDWFQKIQHFLLILLLLAQTSYILRLCLVPIF